MAKTGKLLRVFKTTMQSMSTILPNGKPVPFINGRYCTDVEYDIAHLDAAVTGGHPHIYIDPQDFEIDAGLVDPQEALREKIIQEYLASQAAAIDPNRDMGQTDQNLKLNVGNSANIADAASGGSGLAMNARLMSLKAQSAQVLETLPKPVVAAESLAAAPTGDKVSADEAAAAEARFKAAKKEEADKALAMQLAALRKA